MKFDHATGLWGGIDVSRRSNDPSRASAREVRHASFGHELGEKVRVHAVDAEHDHRGSLLRARGDGDKQDRDGERRDRSTVFIARPAPSRHVRRHRHAEEIEHRRAQVDETCRAVDQRHVREQDTGDDVGIHAMVAAPALGVVFEQLGAHGTLCAVPRHAVAVLVAGEQVGPGVAIGAAPVARHVDDPANAARTAVVELHESSRMRRFSASTSAVSTMPWRSRPFQLMKMPPKPSAYARVRDQSIALKYSPGAAPSRVTNRPSRSSHAFRLTPRRKFLKPWSEMTNSAVLRSTWRNVSPTSTSMRRYISSTALAWRVRSRPALAG